MTRKFRVPLSGIVCLSLVFSPLASSADIVDQIIRQQQQQQYTQQQQQRQAASTQTQTTQQQQLQQQQMQQQQMMQQQQANMAEMARQAAAAQAKAMMAAMIMAAMLAAMCNPQNPAPCIMAPLALAQAASLGGTSAGASNTGNLSSLNPTGAQNSNLPGYGSPGGVPTVTEVKKTLAKNGATLSEDGKTVTMADGKTMAVDASVMTEQGMRSMGLTEPQIAAAKASLAEAQAKAGKVNSPETGSGGGGGVPSAVAAESGAATEAAKKSGRKPSLSGLSKNFGNDKIGVAADNIFEMITRRYKAYEATDTFFKN